ncbi:hypothetical protein [Halorientalis pallida]|uniref:Uncharacterized protein n=1 Tax=Halorientalis pallida TaxID=2479928 RepID=A0A498KZY8_9EURY|nr:hypothetical protein [Halorientalis pallida]RXK46602.1 hypothetical protein EAF64_18145 [Halorientalis pallida]
MEGKFDIPDSVLSPFFVLFSAVSLGLIGFTPLGFDLGSTALEFSADGYATQISFAGILSLLILLVAYATNRGDKSGPQPLQLWLVVTTFALVIVPPFAPLLNAFLGETIPGIIAIVIQAGGYYSLSYMG